MMRNKNKRMEGAAGRPDEGAEEKTRRAVSKRNKRLLPAAGCLLLLLAAAGYTVFIAPLMKREKWVYKETTVERGSLTAGVTESGSLEYGIHSIDYELDLRVDEDSEDEDGEEEASQKYLKVDEIYAAPGQRVASGDALMKFTDDSVNSVRAFLQKALADARTEYGEAEKNYRLSLMEAETEYGIREIAEKYADAIYRSSLEKIENDINVMEIEIQQRTANIPILEKKLAEARDTLEEASRTCEDAVEVFASVETDHTSNFMTLQTQYLNARSSYRSAQTAFEEAENNLEDNAEQIEALQKKIADAGAKRTIDRLDTEQERRESVLNGENAQLTYNAAAESLREELQEAGEELDKIKGKCDAFEAFVGGEGILYAPENGIITEISCGEGDALKETGSLAAYAAPENMTVSVDVTQEDVTALTVGDKVQLAFSAYAGALYEGTILSVNTTATSENTATVSYEVVVGVEGDTAALYGGMTADVTFITEQRENVLYVSRKAIVDQNGGQYVYMKKGNDMELRQVQTGISNGSQIEILSGLEEGDTIYIASRVSDEEAVQEQSRDKEAGQTADTMPEGMNPTGNMSPAEGAGTAAGGRTRPEQAVNR